MSDPAVILISGVPGAGKTTVSHALAQRFARAVHIEGDLIGHHFIVTGLVPPQGPPQDEADRQLLLRRRNICHLADSFADAGFLVVIDDVVVSAEVLDLYRATLRARPMGLVLLDPSRGAIRRRDNDRDKHVFEIWGHLYDQLERWSDAPGLRLDTTELNVGDTVDAIIAHLATTIVV